MLVGHCAALVSLFQCRFFGAGWGTCSWHRRPFRQSHGASTSLCEMRGHSLHAPYMNASAINVSMQCDSIGLIPSDSVCLGSSIHASSAGDTAHPSSTISHPPLHTMWRHRRPSRHMHLICRSYGSCSGKSYPVGIDIVMRSDHTAIVCGTGMQYGVRQAPSDVCFMMTDVNGKS